MTTLDLEWDQLSLTQWREKFAQLPRSGMLQSLPYARAMRRIMAQTPHFALIRVNGEEAGLVQTLEISLLGGLIHTFILDRGPLWFEGYGSQEHVLAFFKEINRRYPRRFGRKRRLIPEVSQNLGINFGALGYRTVSETNPYQTIWMDLTPEPETLRASLKQKWRNSLNKAERQGLKFDTALEPQALLRFLQDYEAQQTARSYRNISAKDLPIFLEEFAKDQTVLLAQAYKKKDAPLAQALIFLHGRSATWQIGTVSNAGRDLCANHFLLWHVISTLRAQGINDFDLGGVNDEDAAGIRNFKTGLGGQAVTLSGLYT